MMKSEQWSSEGATNATTHIIGSGERGGKKPFFSIQKETSDFVSLSLFWLLWIFSVESMFVSKSHHRFHSPAVHEVPHMHCRPGVGVSFSYFQDLVSAFGRKHSENHSQGVCSGFGRLHGI
jgi:hypothetical protein